jgi:DNA-binding NtrC family response regulator
VDDSVRNPMRSDPALPAARSGLPAAALVVADEPTVREFMRFTLSKRCSFVEVAENAARAELLLSRSQFDVLIVDADLPGGLGLGWLESLRHQGRLLPAVVLTDGNPGERELADAPNTRWISKNSSLEHLLSAVEGALDHSGQCAVEHGTAADGVVSCGVGGVITHSEAMRTLLTVIQRVASRNTTVLLEGESGTGKEVAARCLHHFSGRKGPFAPVNCGAISPELLESELFGHIKGAFTGATSHRQGLFSFAEGGTLFLDEICEMPLAMQAKLLRVLEQRMIRPVGMEEEQAVDVRIVAATNRNVAEEVARGNFREDLYYRLNVVALRLPPLRERPSDIPHLVKLFGRRLARELPAPPLEISSEDLRRLVAYPWPGNVRELKNLIERSMLLGTSPVEWLDKRAYDAPLSLATCESELGYPEDLALEEVERRHILKVLRAAEDNKSEAARRLGVSRKTLERKLKAWAI